MASLSLYASFRDIYDFLDDIEKAVTLLNHILVSSPRYRLLLGANTLTYLGSLLAALASNEDPKPSSPDSTTGLKCEDLSRKADTQEQVLPGNDTTLITRPDERMAAAGPEQKHPAVKARLIRSPISAIYHQQSLPCPSPPATVSLDFDIEAACSEKMCQNLDMLITLQKKFRISLSNDRDLIRPIDVVIDERAFLSLVANEELNGNVLSRSDSSQRY